MKIDVIFSENKSGIYGISLFDRSKGVFYKGSELGKDFSWNKLKAQFDTELTVTNREFSKMTLGAYNQIRKEHLKKSYFESQFLTENTPEQIRAYILSKVNPAVLKKPIFMEKLDREVKELIAEKNINFENIRQKEVNFVDYCTGEGIAKLSSLVRPGGTIGNQILEVLNLRFSFKHEKLYHVGDPGLNKDISPDFIRSLGVSGSYFQEMKETSPEVKKALRSLVIKEPPPILFFSDTKTNDFLNEKGQVLFDKMQNEQYINYKHSLFKKKKLTPEKQMLSMLFRGVVPSENKEGKLTGCFYSLSEQEEVSFLLPEEITKGYSLEDLQAISNKIQETPDFHQRLKLNDAIDRKDLFAVRELAGQGVKPLLPLYEMENLDLDIQEALTEKSMSPYNEYVMEIVSGMSGILSLSQGGGGAVDDDPLYKKKKKKRKKNIN